MKTITKKITCNMIACNTTNTGPRSTKLKKKEEYIYHPDRLVNATLGNG